MSSLITTVPFAVQFEDEPVHDQCEAMHLAEVSNDERRSSAQVSVFRVEFAGHSSVEHDADQPAVTRPHGKPRPSLVIDRRAGTIGRNMTYAGRRQSRFVAMWATLSWVLVSCATTPTVAHSNDGEIGRPRIDTAALLKGLPSSPRGGLLVIRCHLSSTGRFTNCVPLEPFPIVGPELVRRIEQQVAEPTTFKGKPVSVNYVFRFRFKAPEPH